MEPGERLRCSRCGQDLAVRVLGPRCAMVGESVCRACSTRRSERGSTPV